MLSVQNLSKTFENGTEALRDVSFEIRPKEFVVVLGKSGSGKSTLMRCLNRLEEPTEGRIYLQGQPVTGSKGVALRQRRRKMGIIFQQYNLVKRSTALTNVLLGRLGYMSSLAGLLNAFSKDDIKKAIQYLDRLEILDQAYQRADTLSGGQQQRVAIARALMQGPLLILADEPVSSLDPGLAKTILDIFREINQQDGVTILCNLHQPDLAREYGQRIIVLDRGQCIFDGSPDQFDHSIAVKVYRTVE